MDAGHYDQRIEEVTFSASVYTVDASGHPDAVHASLTPEHEAGSRYWGDKTPFDAPGGTTLAADTTYAIVVAPSTAGMDLNMEAGTSDDEKDISAPGWSIADAFEYESNGSWQAEASGKSLRIAVRGSAKAGPPGKPTNLSATAMGRYQINLSWEAPSEHSAISPVTGYRIERSLNGTDGS